MRDGGRPGFWKGEIGVCAEGGDPGAPPGASRPVVGPPDEESAAANAPEPGAGATGFDRARRLLSTKLWLGRRDEAALAFRDALDVAGSPADLTQLLDVAPRVFDGFRRQEAWRRLRERAKSLPGENDAALLALRMRLDLALGDRAGFLTQLGCAPPLPDPWRALLRRAGEVYSAPGYPDFEAQKVFGIGLSRTGTTSLGRALEQLGYFHAHLRNPITEQILTEDDFALFDAATDAPVAARFETLYYTYPHARFILTVRPKASWLDSMQRLFEMRTRAFFRHEGRFAGREALGRDAMRHAADRLTEDHRLLFFALYLGHGDFGAAYDAHRQRVERFFVDKPERKLLRLDVFSGDGWRQLCGFLDRPEPGGPYPWSNRGRGPEAPLAEAGAAG